MSRKGGPCLSLLSYEALAATGSHPLSGKVCSLKGQRLAPHSIANERKQAKPGMVRSLGYSGEKLGQEDCRELGQPGLHSESEARPG